MKIRAKNGVLEDGTNLVDIFYFERVRTPEGKAIQYRAFDGTEEKTGLIKVENRKDELAVIKLFVSKMRKIKYVTDIEKGIEVVYKEKFGNPIIKPKSFVGEEKQMMEEIFSLQKSYQKKKALKITGLSLLTAITIGIVSLSGCEHLKDVIQTLSEITAPTPTATPSATPTATPSATPTATPTAKPSTTPTVDPESCGYPEMDALGDQIYELIKEKRPDLLSEGFDSDETKISPTRLDTRELACLLCMDENSNYYPLSIAALGDEAEREALKQRVDLAIDIMYSNIDSKNPTDSIIDLGSIIMDYNEYGVILHNIVVLGKTLSYSNAGLDSPGLYLFGTEEEQERYSKSFYDTLEDQVLGYECCTLDNIEASPYSNALVAVIAGSFQKINDELPLTAEVETEDGTDWVLSRWSNTFESRYYKPIINPETELYCYEEYFEGVRTDNIYSASELTEMSEEDTNLKERGSLADATQTYKDNVAQLQGEVVLESQKVK